jgi:hypothetical protein
LLRLPSSARAEALGSKSTLAFFFGRAGGARRCGSCPVATVRGQQHVRTAAHPSSRRWAPRSKAPSGRRPLPVVHWYLRANRQRAGRSRAEGLPRTRRVPSTQQYHARGNRDGVPGSRRQYAPLRRQTVRTSALSARIRPTEQACTPRASWVRSVHARTYSLTARTCALAGDANRP